MDLSSGSLLSLRTLFQFLIKFMLNILKITLLIGWNRTAFVFRM